MVGHCVSKAHVVQTIWTIVDRNNFEIFNTVLHFRHTSVVNVRLCFNGVLSRMLGYYAESNCNIIYQN